MRCDRCGDELPPDARFCIDCGASLVITGATTRLGELVCSDCYTSNSEDAWNCSNCGRRLKIDTTPPYQPAPVLDDRNASRTSAADLIWLGDFLLAAIDVLTSL